MLGGSWAAASSVPGSAGDLRPTGVGAETPKGPFSSTQVVLYRV